MWTCFVDICSFIIHCHKNSSLDTGNYRARDLSAKLDIPGNEQPVSKHPSKKEKPIALLTLRQLPTLVVEVDRSRRLLATVCKLRDSKALKY